MPTISQFFGISIRIYRDDHPPAHFHAYYGGHSAAISIETLDLLAGALPRRVFTMVLEWAMMHRPELRENWLRAERHDAALPIAPPLWATRRSEMWRVISVKALAGYRLDIEFADGTRGVLDYSQELWGPVFEPLQDPERFAEVGLDEFGAVCWPNGADLAPDAMYDEIKNGTSASR